VNDDVLQTILASESDLAPDLYPHLYNISPAFRFQFLPVLNEVPTAPEYVYVPVDQRTAEDRGSRS
jgi:hypothetical protein